MMRPSLVHKSMVSVFLFLFTCLLDIKQSNRNGIVSANIVSATFTTSGADGDLIYRNYQHVFLIFLIDAVHIFKTQSGLAFFPPFLHISLENSRFYLVSFHPFLFWFYDFPNKRSRKINI